MTPNYCPRCGEDLEQIDSPSFCPGCGTEIDEAETTKETSTAQADKKPLPQRDEDWEQGLRKNEEGLESLAERDDLIGAWARVLLAVVHDEKPDTADMIDAGLEGIAFANVDCGDDL